jgi:F1F0 ATPase subunit 2
MNDVLTLVPALLFGVLLGGIFFGGLWWTVRKGLTARRPALWFFGSLMLRMATVIVGFLFIANGRWERMLACLTGFLIARGATRRLFKAPTEQPSDPAKEVGHET